MGGEERPWSVVCGEVCYSMFIKLRHYLFSSKPRGTERKAMK